VDAEEIRRNEMGSLHSVVGGSSANHGYGGRKERIGLFQAHGSYNFKRQPFC